MLQDVNNGEFTMDELISVKKSAKGGKSVGHDSIPSEILKLPILRDMLLKFFNKCFIAGVIPDEWSKSLITPLQKKGTRTQPCLQVQRS